MKDCKLSEIKKICLEQHCCTFCPLNNSGKCVFLALPFDWNIDDNDDDPSCNKVVSKC